LKYILEFLLYLVLVILFLFFMCKWTYNCCAICCKDHNFQFSWDENFVKYPSLPVRFYIIHMSLLSGLGNVPVSVNVSQGLDYQCFKISSVFGISCTEENWNFEIDSIICSAINVAQLLMYRVEYFDDLLQWYLCAYNGYCTYNTTLLMTLKWHQGHLNYNVYLHSVHVYYWR